MTGPSCRRNARRVFLIGTSSSDHSPGDWLLDGCERWHAGRCNNRWEKVRLLQEQCQRDQGTMREGGMDGGKREDNVKTLVFILYKHNAHPNRFLNVDYFANLPTCPVIPLKTQEQERARKHRECLSEVGAWSPQKSALFRSSQGCRDTSGADV